MARLIVKPLRKRGDVAAAHHAEQLIELENGLAHARDRRGVGKRLCRSNGRASDLIHALRGGPRIGKGEGIRRALERPLWDEAEKRQDATHVFV